jgi:hypothetical protein
MLRRISDVQGDAADVDGGGDDQGSSKKRKIDAGPVPDADVSWTVCCLDGATFSVVVPEQARVAEIKRAIATLREVPCFTMELFVKGVEDGLDDERRVGLADRVPLFMLMKCPSDRLILEALFKGTGGENWTERGGWMTEAKLGDWHGIEVNDEGRVVELKLKENNLVGQLPAELGGLDALTVLWLMDNQLSGVIPAELGQLTALIGLCLHTNQLSGAIPKEIGQLTALTQLTLFTNQLSGAIPREIGELTALMCVHIGNNQLSGAIPMAIGQLPALTILYLGNNSLLSGQQELQQYMLEHNPDCDLRLWPGFPGMEDEDEDEEEGDEEDEDEDEEDWDDE